MCSILLVEDNSTFRSTLREMLAMRFPGMGIEEASNGEEAIVIIERDEPKIVFMDIKLPGKNGLELTKHIKNCKEKIQIIIFTSYDIPEYREAAFRCGASYFLTKGNARSDEILEVVSTALGNKCGENGTAQTVQ